MKIAPKPVEIYGREIEVKVGSIIEPDGWRISERLLPGDHFSSFRIPAGSPIIESIAIEVSVSGRSLQRRNGDLWVRVKIVFPGDGEPDIDHGGWMYVGYDRQLSQFIQSQNQD